MKQTLRIAVATFGSRVSPRFDCASGMTLIEVRDNAVVERQEIALVDLCPRERIELLLSQKADLALCGGLRRCDHHALLHCGIEVISGLIGEVDEIVDQLLQGRLERQQPPYLQRQGVLAHRRQHGRRHMGRCRERS